MSPSWARASAPSGSDGQVRVGDVRAGGGAPGRLVGAGLVQHGQRAGARVGLYMQNRAEWVIRRSTPASPLALCPCPCTDTLGPESVQYIMTHAGVSAVLCTADKLPTILACRQVRGLAQALEHAHCCSWAALPRAAALLCADHVPSGVTVLPFARLEATQGRASPPPFDPLPPGAMCSICYTSGTTGVPKGAMLSHAGMVASAAGSLHGAELYPGDVYLSYLPLAHIYERMNLQALTHRGAAVGFYQGDVMKLMEDLEELRPTVFASVPRLYNRIYDRILGTVKASGASASTSSTWPTTPESALERGRASSAVWEAPGVQQDQGAPGGRVRIMITGASPIAPEVIEFLRM